jgi:hypothetical protein
MEKSLTDDEAQAYAKRYPCVRSGFCCKVRPCPYGAVKSLTDSACRYLEVDHEIIPGVPLYRCGQFEWIMKYVPESEWRMSPAFGGGCSSPMFNNDRNRVIEVLNGRIE